MLDFEKLTVYTKAQLSQEFYKKSDEYSRMLYAMIQKLAV